MLALLIAVCTVFVFMPAQRGFEFEYHLNQPWKYDKLFAPFDFGVYKTKSELEIEFEVIKKQQAPVFSISETMDAQVLGRMHDVWENQSIDSIEQCGSAAEMAAKSLASWLAQGVLQQGEITRELKPGDSVLIERGGILRSMAFTKMLSLSVITDSIRKLKSHINDSICAHRFDSILMTHIYSNAVYNDSLTQKLIDAKFEKVARVQGKVNKGEAIIDKGELVDELHYKMLESLHKETEKRDPYDSGISLQSLGLLMLVSISFGMLMLLVYANEQRLFNDPRPITLSLSLISLCFAAGSMAIASDEVSIYVIPLGITPLLMRMFFDFRLSLFSLLTLVLVLSLFVHNALEFIFIQLLAGAFATLYQTASTKRSKILNTALIVFLGYSTAYTVFSVSQHGNFDALNTANFGWFAINALLCTLVFPLIYVVEKVFGFISETTLMELSDSNQPLLRELAVNAPGTFQHSLQVANLAEKVAARIGGNSVLLRTAALYHDIGKMSAPQFFIENQLPGNNPHDDLDPEESAHIIIGHVEKGVALAREHNLPIQIIQFIITHHGTTAVRFFLKRAMEEGEPDLNDFTYGGPRPATKEQAILMMCDAVEAASRSMKKYDYEQLDLLVDRIIDGQRQEAQFDEAPLTFKDISDAKQTLKQALRGIFHNRISYE